VADHAYILTCPSELAIAGAWHLIYPARPMWRMPIARSRSLGALLALNLSAAALAACGAGGGSSTSSSALPSGCQQVPRPKPKHVDLRPPSSRVAASANLTARVNTSCGAFTITLDAQDSPRTVSSFAYLARKGVYDGTSFNRIVPHFLIQGGDPSETGVGGPGYSVTEPPPPGTQYRRGTVAMAKAAVDPSGRSRSQFFIVTPADAGLPPQYALLGKVSSGWGVVTRIEGAGDPSTGQIGTPRYTVAIRGITVRSR
jgi:cyclophilin family peptidyl-prolyl cis-trans isomerase